MPAPRRLSLALCLLAPCGTDETSGDGASTGDGARISAQEGCSVVCGCICGSDTTGTCALCPSECELQVEIADAQGDDRVLVCEGYITVRATGCERACTVFEE